MNHSTGKNIMVAIKLLQSIAFILYSFNKTLFPFMPIFWGNMLKIFVKSLSLLLVWNFYGEYNPLNHNTCKNIMVAIKLISILINHVYSLFLPKLFYISSFSFSDSIFLIFLPLHFLHFTMEAKNPNERSLFSVEVMFLPLVDPQQLLSCF